MKGQVGIEFLQTVIFAGAVFAIFSIFIAYQFSFLSVNPASDEAEALAQRIAREIDYAYLAGDGYAANFSVPEYIRGQNYTVYYNNTYRSIEVDVEDVGTIDNFGAATYLPSNVVVQNIAGNQVFIVNSGGRVSLWSTTLAPVNDTTPPTITIVSPLNQTYHQDWVWGNVTLNEAGSWCGYSLDGAANVSTSGAGAAWYSNVSSLNSSQHPIRYWCNDTAGNMGASSTRWFTVNVTVSACVNLTLGNAYDLQAENETTPPHTSTTRGSTRAIRRRDGSRAFIGVCSRNTLCQPRSRSWTPWKSIWG